MSDRQGGYSGRVLEVDGGGIAGVLVSDGFQAVRTDAQGRYRLPASGRRVKFVWVTVPAGYRTERFYRPVAEEGPWDFRLERWPPSASGAFSFIHISDSETSEGGPWLEEIRSYVSRAEPRPAFLMHTGDLCHADGIAWHADEVGYETLGLPVSFAIGNHDYLLGDDAERPSWVGYYPGSRYGEDLFERRLGPTYYSFEAGEIHFLVLPSLSSHDATPNTTPADLHEWLQNDLAALEPEQPIVVLQHCPELGPFVVRAEGRDDLDLGRHNLRAVLTGHWHAQQARRGAGGYLSLLTSTPKCGGIDHAPRSFRVVHVEGQAISVHTRIGGIEKQLVTLPPVRQGDGYLHLAAQVYDSARPTEEVSFAVHREGSVPDWRPMRPTAPGWSWLGTAEDTGTPQVFTVRATLAGGTVLQKSRPLPPPTNPPLRPTADWPVYMRNAAHVGTAETAASPPLRLAWTHNVGGHLLHGSPVLSGGRVFVATADDDGAERQGISALAADSGEPLWHFVTRDSIKNSPAAGGGLVFATDLEGRLYALDQSNGASAWEKELGLRGGAGVYEGVVCNADTVYAGSGQGLTALRFDGSVVWQNRAWRQGETCTVTPTLAGGILYASQNWGIGLFAHDAGSGQLLWRVDRNDIRYRDSSVIERDGALYLLADPHLFVLEARSGEVLQQKEIGGLKSTASPLVTQNRILCGTADSGLIALDLQTLEEVWRFVPGHALTPTMPYTQHPSRGFEAAPVLAGDTVYIGGLDGIFYGLDLGSGMARWQCPLGAPILGPAALSGNAIYVADFAGNVHCFAAAL